MRTYYHVAICLAFFFFSFFSPKDHLPFSNRGKNIKESTSIHFLLAKSSISVCILWPIGWLWPEECLTNWYLMPESKHSFETALINLRWQGFTEKKKKFQLSKDVAVPQGEKKKQHGQDSNVPVVNLVRTVKSKSGNNLVNSDESQYVFFLSLWLSPSPSVCLCLSVSFSHWT